MKNIKLPDGWRYIKIRELTDVITGGTPSTKKNEYWENGNIPWLPSGECQDSEIRTASKFITEEGLKNSSAKLMPINTVVIALTGATTGKVGILRIEASANQSVTGIIPNDEFISKYVFYYLRSIRKKILHDSYGGAQKHISQRYVKDLEVLLPPLETQKKIVEVLEKAEEVIEKRKETIRLLDELVKSRFIEMFGEEDYPIVKTEDICEYITKGTTPKTNEIITEYSRGLVPYLKVYNLSFDGSMLFEEKPQYVSEETHNKLLSRSKVFPNDVLMNIVGPPLGKFAIVPNTYNEWNINQAIAIFRATDKINPLYLLYALKQPNVLRPFIDSAVGIRQQNLSLLQCRNLQIPLPPIEIQNQFADFVNQIDKFEI